MEEENKNVGLRHPNRGTVNVPREDLSRYMVDKTKQVIEKAVREHKEEKTKLSQVTEEKAGPSGAPIDTTSKLTEDPSAYFKILNEKYGEDYARRFYGQTTESTDYFRGNPPLPNDQPLPMKISHDIMNNALAAFKNMHIAHEISINSYYCVKAIEKTDKLQDRVHDMLHKAFWDLLEEDLTQNPPIYDHALAVFVQIREQLLALLLPHNGAIRLRIEDMLDVANIKKELEHNALDFQRYTHFIVDCLAQLCSPSRDRLVAEILEIHQTVPVFKKILEVMDIMQLDMVNYIIHINRPKIIEHCVEYERKKFGEFLELEYELEADGLKHTRKWMRRHKIEERDTLSTIAKAFGEIINWQYDRPWPETVALDIARLDNLARMCKRATILGAMTLSLVETCKPLFKQSYPIVFGLIRSDLDSRFKILLPVQDMKDDAKVKENVEACAEESVKDIETHLLTYENRVLDDRQKRAIRNTVTRVLDNGNKVRSLLVTRVVQYIEEVVFSEMQYKVMLPPGLSIIELEIEIIALEFGRIATHNRAVYDDIYTDIIEDRCPTPTFTEADSGPYHAYMSKLKTPPFSTDESAPPSGNSLKTKSTKTSVESISKVSNEPGTTAQSWTPTASSIASFHSHFSVSTKGSSITSHASGRAHTASSVTTTRQSSYDTGISVKSDNNLNEQPQEATVHENEIESKEPQETEPEEDVEVTLAPKENLTKLDVPWTQEDRWRPRPLYLYAAQMLQNRPNPYLLTSTINNDLRMNHPLVFELAQAHVQQQQAPAHKKEVACKVTRKVSKFNDLDDIEGGNWRKFWILNQPIDGGGEDEEEENVSLPTDAQDRGRDQSEQNVEARQEAARKKVVVQLEEREREPMRAQKREMEKGVDHSLKK